MSINIPVSHKVKIAPEFGKLAEIVAWCERNCTSDWRFMEDHDNQLGGYVFLFESEKDYIMFLVWKK